MLLYGDIDIYLLMEVKRIRLAVSLIEGDLVSTQEVGGASIRFFIG